jgi:hypothetical protein
VRGAWGATRSLTADRASHVDSSSPLRQHAKLSLASPVSLGRNIFTRPRPKAEVRSTAAARLKRSFLSRASASLGPPAGFPCCRDIHHFAQTC